MSIYHTERRAGFTDCEQAISNVVADAGVTLVELLVTVAILGIAFVALVGGMSTSIVGSDVHRKQATAESLVRSYAEAVKARTVTYAVCGTPAQYGPAAVGFASVSGYTPSVSNVEYWQPSAGNPSTGTFVVSLATCSNTPPTDTGVQRISIQVASADGRATEKIQIVKRAP